MNTTAARLRRKKIVIAGSTGYVGAELVSALEVAGNYDIIGISRSGSEGNGRRRYKIRKANLFSLKEAERAMEG